MEELLVRGRWASTRTARVYIQSGVAELRSSELLENPTVARYARVCARHASCGTPVVRCDEQPSKVKASLAGTARGMKGP